MSGLFAQAGWGELLAIGASISYSTSLIAIRQGVRSATPIAGVLILSSTVSVLGLVIGLVTGFLPRVDAVVMRVMDGLMAIPTVLLAIALISLSKSSVENVIIAITIPEIPRIARLVRGVVLTLREQIFIDAAVTLGARLPRILFFHIMPNTVAPLIVQATYVCASAIIIEAILSFLGAGTPPDVPSWGNIMAEGRSYVMIAFWILLFPGLFLTVMVLGVNLLGDGLRDTLDPRLRRSTGSL